MVTKSFLVKVLMIVLAAGFAAASMLSAHASDRSDYKSYAKQINETNWASPCGVKAQAVKQDGNWFLHASNVISQGDDVFFEWCGTVDGGGDNNIHCVKGNAINGQDGRKDCQIERMIFAPRQGIQPARLSTGTTVLTDVRETQRKHILVFKVGQTKEYTCEEAYFDRGGKTDPDQTVELNSCTGK